MRIQLGEHAPQIDDSAWVAPNATVIGRVRLAEQVGVWYSAVLRGDLEDISVGAGTNIQDGCVLHADPGFPLTVGTGGTTQSCMAAQLGTTCSSEWVPPS